MRTQNLTIHKTEESSRTACYEGTVDGMFVAVNFDRKKGDDFPESINVQVSDLTKAR